jgi:hypothetical protein
MPKKHSERNGSPQVQREPHSSKAVGKLQVFELGKIHTRTESNHDISQNPINHKKPTAETIKQPNRLTIELSRFETKPNGNILT